ncbi:hypothetical protein [Saccharophagus degradans]|uniref:hypothetical protein n=1 Tax=Saccharophagus degradans TaxID=86304 RepID=UPI00059BF996|nr:hypothetical protein [Saccharophagus degradans]
MSPSKQFYIISCIAAFLGVLGSYLCNAYYHFDIVRYLWLAVTFWVFGAVIPSIALGLIFRTYRQLHLAPLVLIITSSVLYFGIGQRFAILAVGVGITFIIALLIPHAWAVITVRRGK